MKRVMIVLAAVVLAGVGWQSAVTVRGEQARPKEVTAKPVGAQAEAVTAKPTREAVPEPAIVTPPPALDDVQIPPIPEVDDDPFKPGLPPQRVRPPDVIEEGKRLFNREGRLETDKIGRSMFVFDSGDKPMWLLENSWREYLEALTEGGKKKARWRVSGVVTLYGGRNYLLLTKVVRIMPEEEAL